MSHLRFLPNGAHPLEVLLVEGPHPVSAMSCNGVKQGVRKVHVEISVANQRGEGRDRFIECDTPDGAKPGQRITDGCPGMAESLQNIDCFTKDVGRDFQREFAGLGAFYQGSGLWTVIIVVVK